jgi:hypothetical protein
MHTDGSYMGGCGTELRIDANECRVVYGGIRGGADGFWEACERRRNGAVERGDEEETRRRRG